MFHVRTYNFMFHHFTPLYFPFSKYTQQHEKKKTISPFPQLTHHISGSSLPQPPPKTDKWDMFFDINQTTY
ncbi:hypothetical protein Hanom_Chr06g00561611 [Helianthus anomalus]